MGLFKDYREHVAGYRRSYAALETLKPRTWRYLLRQRRQRADRGFADRDTWDFSDYLTDIIIEYLESGGYYGAPGKKHPLGFDGKQTGSEHLFETIRYHRDNWKNGDTFGYTSIDEVITDLKNYRDVMYDLWSDHANVELHTGDRDKHENFFDHLSKDDSYWYDKTTGKRLTSKQVSARMKKWGSEVTKLKKKSDKARDFFFTNDFLWWS